MLITHVLTFHHKIFDDTAFIDNIAQKINYENNKYFTTYHCHW